MSTRRPILGALIPVLLTAWVFGGGVALPVFGGVALPEFGVALPVFGGVTVALPVFGGGVTIALPG